MKMATHDTDTVVDVRNQPYVMQLLGKRYTRVPFESLQISTATIDVRLVECDIDFVKVFEMISIVPQEEQDRFPANHHWPAGTVIGAKYSNRLRGNPPKKDTKGFKNSTTVWIWVKEKCLCVKIHAESLHMTGCKTVQQAAECARYIQQHIELIHEIDQSVYKNYPHVQQIDNCMINYNFNLGVGIDLVMLDKFICENYPKLFIAPYDQNLNGSNMPLKLPELLCSYTIHSNGQVVMRVKEQDIDQAVLNVCVGHECFFKVMEAFNS